MPNTNIAKLFKLQREKLLEKLKTEGDFKPMKETYQSLIEEINKDMDAFLKKNTPSLSKGIDVLKEAGLLDDAALLTLKDQLKNLFKVGYEVGKAISDVLAEKGMMEPKLFFQGSGGQLPGAIAILGEMQDELAKLDEEYEDNKDNEEYKKKRADKLAQIEGACFYASTRYDLSNPDFSDVDVGLPLEGFVPEYEEALKALGDLKSSSRLKGKSSFSHIFSGVGSDPCDDQDIDIVIHEQRTAQNFAPRIPDMSVRFNMPHGSGDDIQNTAFIRSHSIAEPDPTLGDIVMDRHRRPSIGPVDRSLAGKTSDKIRKFYKIGMSGYNELEIIYDPDSDTVEDDLKAKKDLFKDIKVEDVRKTVEKWDKKKKAKSEKIVESLQDLNNDLDVEVDPLAPKIDDATEFRKNMKQFQKPAPLEELPDKEDNEDAWKEAVKKQQSRAIAFWNLIVKHLDCGMDLDELGKKDYKEKVVDFTSSYLSKKHYFDKDTKKQQEFLEGQIRTLKNTNKYLELLGQMADSINLDDVGDLDDKTEAEKSIIAMAKEKARIKKSKDFFLAQRGFYQTLLDGLKESI